MLPERLSILDKTVELVSDAYEVLAESGSSTRRTRGVYYESPRDTAEKEFMNSDGLVRHSYSYTITNDPCSDEYNETIENVFEEQICAPSVQGSPLLSVLGHGCYSVVLECRDPSVVIKVGMGNSGNGDVWADGWLDYAVFCMQNKGMFGTPKVHGIKVFDDSGFYVAMLDKYVSAVGNMDMDVYTQYQYYSAQQRMKAMVHGIRPFKDWDGHAEAAAKFPRYRQAGKEIRDGLKAYGARDSFDLHAWNFMLDRRNRIILTDPSASACTKVTKDILTKGLLTREAA